MGSEQELELVIARVPLVELSRAVMLAQAHERVKEPLLASAVERVPGRAIPAYSLRQAVPAVQREQR